jgi:hypothetical protein
MKKSLKSAVIVLAVFFLFIAPVHNAMLQSPPVELYTLLEVDNDNDADGAETCSEFVCCTFEKMLLILDEPKP